MTFDELGRLTIEPNSQVQLKPYQPRPPKPYTLATDQEILDGAGGTLVVDSEIYPNYFLAAFRDIKTDKVIKFESKPIGNGLFETFDERKLSWVLHSYRTIGFNSIKFDIPLLWLSYKIKHPQILKRAAMDLIGGMWWQELQKEYDFKIHPTNHIDLIEVCPLRGSLKLYGARLHAERIQELPIHHDTHLDQNQIEIVSGYCISSDLPATSLLFNNLTEQLKLRENLSAEYRQDVMSKSDAQIAETVIGSELKRITGKWPSKPKIVGGTSYNYNAPAFLFYQSPKLKTILSVVSNATYSVTEHGRLVLPKEIENLKLPIGNGVYRIGIGGLHSSEKEISYKADDEYELIDRDVESYYPRILLNQGLFPEHIGIDFLNVYSSIVDRRVQAKKNKQISISENLKVTINGTFGKTGSPYSILYSPQITIQITLTGQLALLMLIEYLELNGIDVISANTDGIVSRVHKSKKEIFNKIISEWEIITNFKTEETKYSAVYSRDVNAYMAIKFPKDGKIEVKGKNVYYDPWRSTNPKDLYWRFQKNPNAQICVEAVERLITHNEPIDVTIKFESDFRKFVCVKNVKGGAHKNGEYLGKVVRWYMAKDVVGTINYILNDNKVPDTEGAKPAMDLPETFPSDINYDWYIAKATELLYDMAYLKRSKQIRFF